MAPKILMDLPNEVIHQILQHLPPTAVPSLDLVSKGFRTLARQPVLWQHFCRKDYKYWDQRRSIAGKFADNVVNVDWKGIYSERHAIDRSTTQAIDSILNSQTGRIEKAESIVSFGYDAKDTLMLHLHVGDDAEDVLARRYYSKAVLGSLHRAAAVQEWARLRDGQEVSLERALAAFDMFVLLDNEEDFDSVSARLDRIAHQIRVIEPELDDLSPRRRAIAIAKFLRRNKFTGVRDEAQYHALAHNFLGISLQDEEHQCLPLITVAIYCCVAQRLGLDAQPCGFPFHVHAIIKARQGQDLDGRDLAECSEARSMYMDPWNSSQETSEEELVTRLKEMKINPSDFSMLLGVSSTADIVRRTARNILNSVKILSHSAGYAASTEHTTFPNMDGAFYGALWALLMLTEDDSVQASVQRDRYISYMVQHLERLFHLDVPVFEEHILSLFHGREHYSNICAAVRRMRTDDLKPKLPKRRLRGQPDHVQYKVGQVFKHKRYRYQAIITGWDKECEAGELWIAQMGVQNLPNGRYQAFYHVMVDDMSVRYVAEENIEVAVTEDINPTLMAIAGQNFKRWDEKSKVFISNIKDEYPDD